MHKRHKIKTLTATLLSCTAIAAPVFAQDVVDIGPTRITAPLAETTIFAFDGFYTGLMADYSTISGIDFRDATDDEGNVVAFSDGSSYLGYGLVIGVNMVDYRYNDIRSVQRPTFVYGVELGLNGGSNETVLDECRTHITCTTKVSNGLVSLAGRFGVVMPQVSNAMMYAKAGWTSKKVELSAVFDNGIVNSEIGTQELTINGVSLGAGIEFALSNAITARIEGNYMNYGDFEAQVADGPFLEANFDNVGLAAGLSYNF